MAIFGSEISQSDLYVRANGVDKSLDSVLPPHHFFQLSREAISVLYRGDCASQNAIFQIKYIASFNYFVTFLYPFFIPVLQPEQLLSTAIRVVPLNSSWMHLFFIRSDHSHRVDQAVFVVGQ